MMDEHQHQINQQRVAQYVDYLIEMAKSQPEKLVEKEMMCATSKWKTIHQKLFDIYLEESRKQPANKNVLCTSNLLARLVDRDHLSTIIINLYPGNEGYSLMLRGRSGADTETIRLPYEENELLDYIDAEKLPPLLVDLLDKAQANLFHSGCVVAEVRDYRRSMNNTYDTVFVLLQPSMHTMLCDINAITSESPGWTSEEKLALESQMLLQTSDPLCLDPSPAVFMLATKMNYHKHKFNTPSLRRYAKKHSQAAINRRRKLSLSATPKHLRLLDFATTKKSKTTSNPVNLKIGKPAVDMWKMPDVQLTTPENIDVMRFVKAVESSELASDNNPIVLEEYTFETERAQGKVNLSRLTIKQRLSDEFYIGSLYVDRDYKEGQSNGSECSFPLGTRSNVERYIRQFREIFTEEGRRQVKITHQTPGQMPTVTYTQVTQPVSNALQSTPGVGESGQIPRPPAVSGLVNSGANILGQGPGLLNAVPSQASASIGDSSSARLVAPLRLSLSFNPNLATLASPTNAGNAVAHLRFCLPQQQQQQQQQQMLNRQKSIPTPGTPNTPGHLGLQQSPAAMSSMASASVSGANLSYTSVIGKLPVLSPGMPHLASPTSRSSMTLRTEASNLTELLLGDSLTNPGLMQAKQNVWNASGQQPMVSAAAGAGNAMNSLSLVSPPNVNIGSASALPPNINIQNIGGLQGLGLVNLQNSSSPVVSGNLQQQRAYVAMVTTGPGASPSINAAPLASPPTNMLSPSSSSETISMPIGVTGSITKFMNPTSLKGSNVIRPGAPLLLSTQAMHLIGSRGGQLLNPSPVNQDSLMVTSPGSGTPFRPLMQMNPSSQSYQQVAPPNVSLQPQHLHGKPGAGQQTASKNKAKKGPTPNQPKQ